MKLKYFLKKSAFKDRPNMYFANLHDVRIYYLKEIVDRMSGRGTTLTKSDIIAAINLLMEEIILIIKEGGAVNLPLFRTIYSIAGKFKSASDTFNSKRHKIKIKFLPVDELLKALEELELEKTRTPIALPTIFKVIDVVSGSTNDIITPNGFLKIIGTTLKIVGDNLANGVYLIDSNGVEYKHLQIANNSPTELIITLPPLAEGTYELYVRTQYRAGTILKNPRTGYFAKPLKVL